MPRKFDFCIHFQLRCLIQGNTEITIQHCGFSHYDSDFPIHKIQHDHWSQWCPSWARVATPVIQSEFECERMKPTSGNLYQSTVRFTFSRNPDVTVTILTWLHCAREELAAHMARSSSSIRFSDLQASSLLTTSLRAPVLWKMKNRLNRCYGLWP